jgi:phage baseplate assembly protein V
MADHEHVMNQRTGATRALVSAVNDTGLVQTLDAQSHDGVVRGGAEVHQPFGFNSCAPGQGAVTVFVANGGDPSDMLALPPSCPAARLGGLAPGESVIYAADGTRVHLKAGGIVEVLAATQVVITAPQCTVAASSGITLTGAVTITGAVSITGTLHVSGDVDVGGNVNAAGSINGH